MVKNLYVDCVFLVFLMIGAIKGAKKGVFGSFFKVVVFICSTIAAIFISNKIVELWLSESEIGVWLESQISAFIKNICKNVETKEDFLNLLQQKNNIIAIIMTKIIDSIEIGQGDNFIGAISQKTTVILEKAVVFIIVFLIVYIFLRKITSFAGKISKISVVGGVDKIFGVLFGVVKAAIFFGIFYFGVGVLSNLVQNQILTNLMQNDKMVSVLYNMVYEKTISVFLPY